MEVLFVVLAGGGIGALVVFAMARRLRKADERQQERTQEEGRQIENSLTERLGAAPKKPNRSAG